MPNWKDLPDLNWAARFAYQAIEKRGTGGGNFRLLYADFIQELNLMMGFDPLLAQGFRQAAKMWSDLGASFKELAFCELDECERVVEGVLRDLGSIILLEENLFQAILEQLKHHQA
ncbi:MAG: DUF4872 domain-containing protein [Deinococcales bacterium]